MSQAETKVIPQDFILITYDIPAKFKVLRSQFLRDARAIGAEQHTASVYLMPYSEGAMKLANKLESAGHAVVWGPVHQPDKAKAEEYIVKYEDALRVRCELIEQRLAQAQHYIVGGQLEVAKFMGIKTGKLLNQLAKIAESYESDWLMPKIMELLAKLKEVYG